MTVLNISRVFALPATHRAGGRCATGALYFAARELCVTQSVAVRSPVKARCWRRATVCRVPVCRQTCADLPAGISVLANELLQESGHRCWLHESDERERRRSLLVFGNSTIEVVCLFLLSSSNTRWFSRGSCFASRRIAGCHQFDGFIFNSVRRWAIIFIVRKITASASASKHVAVENQQTSGVTG